MLKIVTNAVFTMNILVSHFYHINCCLVAACCCHVITFLRKDVRLTSAFSFLAIYGKIDHRILYIAV